MTIYANCSYLTYDKNTSENITIINIPPILSFVSMNNSGGTFSLITGSFYEYYSGNWEFLFNASDNDIDNIRLQFVNSSGQSIYNQTYANFPTHILIDGDLIVEFAGNPVNISLWVNDTNSDISYISMWFNVTDIHPPTCSNLISSTEIIGDTYIFNTICTDQNFFSFNLTCGNILDNYSIGLNVNQFDYTNNITINESFTCVYKMCDGHTEERLSKDFYSSIDEKTIKVEHNNKKVEFGVLDNVELVSADIIRKRDRISFKYTFIEKSEKKKIFYYITSPNAYYLKDSIYPAHIVDYDSLTWFDLVLKGNEKLDYEINRLNSTYWEIIINSDLNILEFQSIGELNCINGQFTITSKADAGISNLDDYTLNEIIVIILLIGILVFMTITTIVLRIPAIMLVIGLLWMGVGIFIQLLHFTFWLNLIGIGVIVWGIVLMAIGFKFGGKN